MAVKGKKRSAEGSDAPAKAIEKKQQQQPSSKKAKVEKQEPVKSNGTVAPQKTLKKDKQAQSKPDKTPKIEKTAAVKEKKSKNVEKKSNSGDAAAEAKANGALLDALIKRKQRKREKRRQARNKFGQYKPENIYASAEELESRIEKIKSQGKLSKTARRRLSVLKKKLNIKQGTYVPPTKPLAKVGESRKRALRRQNAAFERSETADGSKDEVVDKALRAANAVKGIKVKQNIPKNVVKVEKIKSEKKIKKQSEQIEKMSDDDDEDDDESDEQDDSMNVSNVSEDLDDSKAEEEDDDDDDDEEEEEEEEGEEDDDDDDDDEEEEEEEEEPKQDKKKSAKQAQKSSNDVAKDQPAKKAQPEKQDKKTRYVLFIGNLPYTATVDDIKKHFLTKVSDISSVRIPPNPKTNSPRGIAYVEFTNTIDYEKGLSLHHSNLNGRRINVEYSTGGSKTVNKRPEIFAKNQKLHALRKQGKLAGSVKDSQKRNARRNKPKHQSA